jgi:zinc protease
VAPTLDKTFGALSAGSGESLRQERPLVELEGGSGARRLQASTLRERHLLMAWRIPPLPHPSTPTLKVLAELLGGGPNARLMKRLMGAQPMAKSLRVLTGVPGGRETSLLVVEAVPLAEHPLAELEQAVLSEIMKLQQGAILPEEIQRAQRLVEAEEVRVQEDAAKLASVLGAACCQGGDWHLAFRGLALNRDLSPEEVRGVAQKYLVPTQVTTALLEPDPILSPEDRQEARLVALLKRVLEGRIEDPARVEMVARETLRQLRMVPSGDRDRIIKLLEAQVKP